MTTAERDEAPEPPSGGERGTPAAPDAPVAQPEAVPTGAGTGQPVVGVGRWLLVTGVIVVATVLLCVTMVAAEVLNPDLAVMPPVFRQPRESPAGPPGPPVPVASVTSSPTPVASSPPPSSRPPRPPRPAASPVSYEAESAKLRGVRTRSESSASGGKLVYDLDTPIDYVEFAITVPAAGTYTVTVYYTCGAKACGVNTAVNGGKRVKRDLPSTEGWGRVGSVTLSVDLAAGGNTLRFTDPRNARAPYLDRITVVR